MTLPRDNAPTLNTRIRSFFGNNYAVVYRAGRYAAICLLQNYIKQFTQHHKKNKCLFYDRQVHFVKWTLYCILSVPYCLPTQMGSNSARLFKNSGWFRHSDDACSSDHVTVKNARLTKIQVFICHSDQYWTQH